MAEVQVLRKTMVVERGDVFRVLLGVTGEAADWQQAEAERPVAGLEQRAKGL